MKLVPRILCHVGIIGDFTCRKREINVFVLKAGPYFIVPKVPGLEIYFTGDMSSSQIEPAVSLLTGEFQT